MFFRGGEGSAKFLLHGFMSRIDKFCFGGEPWRCAVHLTLYNIGDCAGDPASVLVRVKLVSARHCNSYRREGVQYPNAVSVLCKNLRQTFVAIRRFIQSGSAQLDVRL